MLIWLHSFFLQLDLLNLSRLSEFLREDGGEAEADGGALHVCVQPGLITSQVDPQ